MLFEEENLLLDNYGMYIDDNVYSKHIDNYICSYNKGIFDDIGFKYVINVHITKTEIFSIGYYHFIDSNNEEYKPNITYYINSANCTKIYSVKKMENFFEKVWRCLNIMYYRV